MTYTKRVRTIEYTLSTFDGRGSVELHAVEPSGYCGPLLQEWTYTNRKERTATLATINDFIQSNGYKLSQHWTQE